MKTSVIRLLCLITIVALTPTSKAEYKETMDPNGPTRNLQLDYGLVDDDASTDQSKTFQKAIDDLAAQGGGRLIVPKGTYRLAGVRLRSNIHLLIEKDTVIKPYWPEGMKTVVFRLDADRPTNRKEMTEEQERAFIENVSIRGLGGRWIADYSDREPKQGEGVRQVLATMVRNFLIADLDVKDNFTPEEYYDDLKLRWFDKFFEGPSIRAVKDSTQGHYRVRIENVTMEGFTYNADKPILTDEDERPGKWGEELRKWKAAHK